MKTKRKGLMLILGVLLLVSTMMVFATGASAASADAATVCEHEYEEAVYAATCTERGYTEYNCSLCGDSYKDNYTAANGHDFSDLLIPATCTEKGFTTHFCKVCGYQYSENYTEALGHVYTDVIFEPTCTEVGYTEHTCDVCKETFVDTFIEKLGHTYTEEITEATCTENGYTTFTCDVCGESHNGDEVEAFGHEYGANPVEATCVAYGYTEHICLGCNARYVTDYVKPLGHDYKEVVVPATEEQLGYTKHTCKTCGNTYLSDFSSSKDNGYIEVPEEPVHHHEYKLITTVNRTDKLITLAFDCQCGEQGADLVTLLFAANDGEITTVKPDENGTVNYAEFTGNLAVTVVDDYGNVLKEFSIENGEVIDTPEVPDIPENPDDNPDNPDTPDIPDEHTHNFILYSTMNEADKVITLNYMCDCTEAQTATLTAVFTDADGNVIELVPNENGELNCAELNGKYMYEVKSADGEILTSYEVTLGQTELPDNPDTPDIPDEPIPDNPETPDNTENEDNGEQDEDKGGSAIGVVLIIVLIVLGIAGGVTFYFIKKKGKKSKN